MKVNKLTPNLEVKDIESTVTFYQSVLGFTLVMAVPSTQDAMDESFISDKDYVYALVKKDNVELMFQRTDSFKQDVVLARGLPIGASVSFYMEVNGLDDFFVSIKDKVDVFTAPEMAWYGMREFYLKDINGYILGFAEKVE